MDKNICLIKGRPEAYFEKGWLAVRLEINSKVFSKHESTPKTPI